MSARHGTLFVVAAGNSGPGRETVGSPGSADAALTAGAVDRDDSLSVNVPLWGDGSGNAGFSRVDSGVTTLYRDGKKIGESPYDGYGAFQLPADTGDYTLSTEAVRTNTGVSDVTTAVRASWTFRSSPVGTDPVTVPLSAVRYLPALEATNSARPASRSSCRSRYRHRTAAQARYRGR